METSLSYSNKLKQEDKMLTLEELGLDVAIEAYINQDQKIITKSGDTRNEETEGFEMELLSSFLAVDDPESEYQNLSYIQEKKNFSISKTNNPNSETNKQCGFHGCIKSISLENGYCLSHSFTSMGKRMNPDSQTYFSKVGLSTNSIISTATTNQLTKLAFEEYLLRHTTDSKTTTSKRKLRESIYEPTSNRTSHEITKEELEFWLGDENSTERYENSRSSTWKYETSCQIPVIKMPRIEGYNDIASTFNYFTRIA